MKNGWGWGGGGEEAEECNGVCVLNAAADHFKEERGDYSLEANFGVEVNFISRYTLS